MQWLCVYLLVLGVAFGGGWWACGLARRVGLRLGWLDYPGGRKAHPEPVAVTGGYGIALTFLALAGAGTLLGPALAGLLPQGAADSGAATLAHYLRNIAGVRAQVGAVLAGAALLFVVGAIDDRHPLGPRLKLGLLFVAAALPLAGGVMIRGFLPAPLGGALTVLWIVAITNAFNLLDNMDGLSALVALVTCLVMALAAWLGGELWLPALFLTLAGTLGGFLIYNFHPARMFMGDAGALVIGYLCAVFSILITYYSRGAAPTALPVLMPLFIMGVPLFDTLSVMWIRWRAGKPLMVGDRNHFSHRLLALGFGVRGTALTIAALTGATGLLALPLRVLPWSGALLHLLALGLLFGVIAAIEFTSRRGRG